MGKRTTAGTGQISMFDEIIVDSFAGGGGASTGIEIATGRVVDIAINHDPDAILMHRTNHPWTEHYQASVWDIDPKTVCKGRQVGLLWASPDCKHFSKAKGSALVDRNIRGLAWVVLRWAATVRPRVIMLENVEEFVTWGPVRKGKPVKKHSGETFRKWKNQLLSLGYAVEHRELVAADYGAPTSRKRFVLVARCDGRPIVWPELTHAPADSEEVKSGKCKPWRAAAEIIDWTLPMYSVFDSKEEIKRKFGVNAVRPLADATMRRIICGTDKYTIKSEKPFFIVPTGYGERDGQAPRTHDPDKPLSTVVSTVKQNVVEPIMTPFTFTNTGHSVGNSANQPTGTVRTSGGIALGAANLVCYHADKDGNARTNGLDEPIPTIDASNRFGLTTAQLVEYYGNATPPDLREPMRTVTSHDREGLTCCHIAEFKGKDKGQDARKPLRTITASCGEFAAVKTIIEQYDAERTADGRPYGYWPEIRALLNKYCGYKLKDNEILLLIVDGTPFYIRDILLRMLAPRELYNAMGFPPDYIIDHDYTGKEYGKSKQVARCGNAVCPPMASAVVRANLPEWCGGKIETMEQFRKGVAV